jgi:hypothetical protein
MSWTKEHAVEYCINTAKLTINTYCKDPIAVLRVYQQILFPDRQHSFYARIWNETVLESLNTMVYDRYNEPENIIASVKQAFTNEEEPENLEHFLICINNIKTSIGFVNIDPVIWCVSGIQSYVIKQLNRLYKKDISGPECLMRYIYPYATHLNLPKEDFTWLIPSIKIVIVNLSIKTNKDAPIKCSFCKKKNTTTAFAIRSTLYTYNVFTTCNDCMEFKDYYNICYLSNDSNTIDVPITEENQLDLSCLEKK